MESIAIPLSFPADGRSAAEHNLPDGQEANIAPSDAQRLALA
jgi:hypothetical protein